MGVKRKHPTRKRRVFWKMPMVERGEFRGAERGRVGLGRPIRWVAVNFVGCYIFG